MTASTRVKRLFDANISLSTDKDDELAQKIVHNAMHENSIAFTRLHAAVEAAGGWQALAVAVRGKTRRGTGEVQQQSGASWSRQARMSSCMSEVVLLYRLLSAMQKLEGGTSQKHARRFGLGGKYSYASHLEGKRDFNFTKMRTTHQSIAPTVCRQQGAAGFARRDTRLDDR